MGNQTSSSDIRTNQDPKRTPGRDDAPKSGAGMDKNSKRGQGDDKGGGQAGHRSNDGHGQSGSKTR